MHRYTWVLLLFLPVFLAPIEGSAGGSASLSATVAVTAATRQVGIYVDNSCTALAAFSSWIGQPSTAGIYMLQYNPGGTPTTSFQPGLSQIEAAVQQAQCGNGTAQAQVISITFFDTSTNVVAGAWDVYYKNVATALATYAPNAIVRLSWEFNGGWFAWGIDTYPSPPSLGYTAASFVAAWQHVVTVMRGVSGTSGLKFDWCPDLCPGCADPVPAYPGDAYVNVVGLDFYDTSDTGDAAADWNNAVNCFRCLSWQVSFAQSHGKYLSLPEWGVGYANNKLDDQHGAYFVTQTAAWMRTYNYLYFDYWNTNEAYCAVISGPANGGVCPAGYAPLTYGAPYQLPNSAAAFLAASFE